MDNGYNQGRHYTRDNLYSGYISHNCNGNNDVYIVKYK